MSLYRFLKDLRTLSNAVYSALCSSSYSSLFSVSPLLTVEFCSWLTNKVTSGDLDAPTRCWSRIYSFRKLIFDTWVGHDFDRRVAFKLLFPPRWDLIRFQTWIWSLAGVNEYEGRSNSHCWYFSSWAKATVVWLQPMKYVYEGNRTL